MSGTDFPPDMPMECCWFPTQVNITQQKISNFNDILEKQKIEEKEAEDKVDKFYDPRCAFCFPLSCFIP